MNIKCIAIDDEPLALRQIESYLKKVPFFEVTGSCLSALEAMRLMERQPADVLFIDINMPDLNGLDFVRSLKNPPMVVFTTAYSEYAIEGYKVEAVDYLLKPFGMADVMASANKVRRRYELTRRDEAASSEDAIFLKTDYKMVRVAISDIILVEGMSEYLRIHVNGQPKPVVTLLSMKKMEDRLEGHGFMRVHKSFIVSLCHIRELNKTRIVTDTGMEIPVGDTYRDALNRYVANKYLIR